MAMRMTACERVINLVESTMVIGDPACFDPDEAPPPWSWFMTRITPSSGYLYIRSRVDNLMEAEGGGWLLPKM